MCLCVSFCVYDVGKKVSWCMNRTLGELLHGELADLSADSKVNMLVILDTKIGNT